MLPPPRAAAPLRRVVVTGVGMVSPLGPTAALSWRALLDGACGVRSLSDDPRFSQFPCTVVAGVRRGQGAGEFDARAAIDNSRTQAVPFIELALAAAADAMESAQWSSVPEASRARTGVAIGSGIGALEHIIDGAATLASDRGYRKLSPFFVPRILANMAAAHVSMRHGLTGPSHTVSTACTTGAHAVGDAFRFVRHGDADIMLAGASESCIVPLAVAGFCRATALATKYNDQPTRASRPFDRARDGFVMGEGAAVLVLEELEHARARGAPLLCEIRGYGLSSDAAHITTPPPDGAGALRAMRAALQDAALLPEHVDYVNAHATSTPAGDVAELRALEALFGDHSPNVMVSSTKGATGHLLGAAGAIECAFTALALHEGVVPATLNLEEPEESMLRLVARSPGHRPLRAALSNSFGFGGTNASVALARL